MTLLRTLLFLLLLPAFACGSDEAQAAFAEGNHAYAAGEYDAAIAAYIRALEHGQSAALHYNLGNAFLQTQRLGPVILHYQKALAIDPSNADVQANLSIALQRSGLPVPEMPWLERYAAWLPVGAWGWLAALSFWALAALLLLPRWLGVRPMWPRLLAFAALVLLSAGMTGLAGWHIRAKLGIVLNSETPLKISPTSASPVSAYLPAGMPAHIERKHGDYYYVQTPTDKEGWLSKVDFSPVWETDD